MPAVQTIAPQFIVTFGQNGQITLCQVTSGVITGVTTQQLTQTTRDMNPVKEILDIEFARNFT